MRYRVSHLLYRIVHVYETNPLQPMFIMMNDGGSSNENTDDNTARRLLLQRLIIKDVLYEGMAVVLLAPAEFRDSKVFIEHAHLSDWIGAN